MSDKPFVAVIITRRNLKHLLVDRETRRTACGKVLRGGTIHEGLDMWNSHAPIRCRNCKIEWKRQGSGKL